MTIDRTLAKAAGIAAAVTIAIASYSANKHAQAMQISMTPKFSETRETYHQASELEKKALQEVSQIKNWTNPDFPAQAYANFAKVNALTAKAKSMMPESEYKTLEEKFMTAIDRSAVSSMFCIFGAGLTLSLAYDSLKKRREYNI